MCQAQGPKSLLSGRLRSCRERVTNKIIYIKQTEGQRVSDEGLGKQEGEGEEGVVELEGIELKF